MADGLLYHAMNGGNNRGAVFFESRDYLTFLKALAQTKERYPFRLFGYCLMTNHFHLLLSPGPGQSISRILQSLTVAHTWHYHKAQEKSVSVHFFIDRTTNRLVSSWNASRTPTCG